MARQDGRIEKGQPLRTAISAKAWNRAQQAADVVLGVQPGVAADGLRGYERPYTWVHVYNNTGSSLYDIPRWGPVWLRGGDERSTFYNTNVNDSPENEAFFQDVPVLAGVPPTAYSGPNYGDPPVLWGIAVEPIAHDAIGKVAISGVVQCRLNVANEYDTHVVMSASSKSELSTGSGGDAVILHKDGGTGSGKWGLIRLGTQHLLRRAKITSGWAFESSRELTDDDGVTFTATNLCQTLTVPISFLGATGYTTLSERWVYCAMVGGSWQLISWTNGLTSEVALRQNMPSTAIIPI